LTPLAIDACSCRLVQLESSASELQNESNRGSILHLDQPPALLGLLPVDDGQSRRTTTTIVRLAHDSDHVRELGLFAFAFFFFEDV
jgi:hypothetical protein